MTERAGPKGPARTGQPLQPETAWGFLFPENIIDAVVEHTNRKTELCRANFAADLLDKQTFTKPIDQVELRAFFGLIYLAGLFKSENEDATGLFASDGTGRDIF